MFLSEEFGGLFYVNALCVSWRLLVTEIVTSFGIVYVHGIGCISAMHSRPADDALAVFHGLCATCFARVLALSV